MSTHIIPRHCIWKVERWVGSWTGYPFQIAFIGVSGHWGSGVEFIMKWSFTITVLPAQTLPLCDFAYLAGGGFMQTVQEVDEHE